MTDQQRPVGERFSFAYMRRPLGLKDGKRVRRRVAQAFHDIGFQRISALPQHIEGEIGIDVPVGYDSTNWWRFWEECDLDVFLDAITLVTHPVPLSMRDKWRKAVERILREEQTAYTTDEECGIHPYVDAEFQRVRVAAIGALNSERYDIAVAALKKAYDHLHGSPVQARDAIKAAFEANETLFKLLSPRSPSLTAGDARTALGPLIDRRFVGTDPVAQRATHKMLAGLCDWVDAAHNYRHAPGEGEPPEPPEEVWHLLVSQAAAYVRWLVELDRALNN